LAALRSDRTRLLFIDLVRWIETGKWSAAGNSDLEEPIVKIARRLLDKRLDKLQDRVRHIVKAKARERHRIRIAAKKLRLMCEFFESLIGGSRQRREYDRIVTAVSELQKVLGRMQDDVVRTDFLATLTHDAQAKLDGPGRACLDAAVEALTPKRS